MIKQTYHLLNGRRIHLPLS